MKDIHSSQNELPFISQFIGLSSQAKSTDQIFTELAKILLKSRYFSLVLAANKDHLQLISNSQSQHEELSLNSGWIPIPPKILKLRTPSPVLFKIEPHADQPEELLKLLQELNFSSGAIFPILSDGSLAGLFVLGNLENNAHTTASLEPYTSLAKLSSTALEKIQAIQRLEKRLVALQTLDTVGKTISLETDLKNLYPIIHREISQVMGEIDFLIALYDTETGIIEIPYAYEQGKEIKLPSLTLGQGLTSILIRTGQSLLITESIERQAAALGARIVGMPAKSWLGVPLLVAGEAIGAIVVQDLINEGRFTEEDRDLINTLASQVAIAVRNAYLLEKTRQQVERERIIADISAKLWATTDVDNILRTAVYEIGRTLGVSEGVIHLQSPDMEGN